MQNENREIELAIRIRVLYARSRVGWHKAGFRVFDGGEPSSLVTPLTLQRAETVINQ